MMIIIIFIIIMVLVVAVQPLLTKNTSLKTLEKLNKYEDLKIEIVEYGISKQHYLLLLWLWKWYQKGQTIIQNKLLVDLKYGGKNPTYGYFSHLQLICFYPMTTTFFPLWLHGISSVHIASFKTTCCLLKSLLETSGQLLLHKAKPHHNGNNYSSSSNDNNKAIIIIAIIKIIVKATIIIIIIKAIIFMKKIFIWFLFFVLPQIFICFLFLWKSSIKKK